MESDEMLSERQSIRESARQLKKYGSTCNHVRNNEYFIRHNLEQTDTLQGIALKYGCTVSDNFFLVRFLLFVSMKKKITTIASLLSLSILFFGQTEQIRRANRLFAQDSLFLRQYLMIPVDRDTSLQHNQQSKSLPSPMKSPTDDHLLFATTSTSLSPSTSASNAATSSNTKHDKHHPILSPEEESKRSIEDFLGKIDSTLAKTKNYVKNR